MTTINIEHISETNKRIARIINDLGELLIKEDIKLYEIVVCENFSDLQEKVDEKEFLYQLYQSILNKLKEVKFE